jgi:hypothetical protein
MGQGIPFYLKIKGKDFPVNLIPTDPAQVSYLNNHNILCAK